MLTIQYLLESAFCLSCLYALYWLLLRRETFFQWNRAYLLLAPVLACVAPALHIRIAAAVPPAAAAPSTGDLMPAPLADLPQWVDRLQTAPRLVGQALAQPLWSLTVGEALRWVYGVVAALFLLQLLVQVWRLLSFLRRCKRTEQAGVVLATGPAGAPLASFFGFVFWHPGDAADSEQRLLFEHEMVHVRQWHSLDLLLMEMLIALQWFNPLLYVYRRSLRTVHEYIADDYVVRRTRQRYAYARLLAVRQATGNGAQPGLVNTFHSCIKNRLIMLAKRPSSPLRRAKYLLALPLFAALLLLFSFRLVERLPAASPLVKATQTLENYSARLSEVVIAGARIGAPEPSPYRFYWGSLQAKFEFLPGKKIYQAEIASSPEELREALKREPRVWNGQGLEQLASFQCGDLRVRSDYNDESVYEAVRPALETLVAGLAKGQSLLLEQIVLPGGNRGQVRIELSGEAPSWLPRRDMEVKYQSDPGRDDFFQRLQWGPDELSMSARQFFSVVEFWQIMNSTPRFDGPGGGAPDRFNLSIYDQNGQASLRFSGLGLPYDLETLRGKLHDAQLGPGNTVWISAEAADAGPAGSFTRIAPARQDTFISGPTVVVRTPTEVAVFDLVTPDDPRRLLQRADQHEFKLEWGNYSTSLGKMYARRLVDANNQPLHADRPREQVNYTMRKRDILQMLRLPLRLYRDEQVLDNPRFVIQFNGEAVSAEGSRVPAAFLEKLERALQPGDVLLVNGMYVDQQQVDLSSVTLRFEVRSEDPKPPLDRSVQAEPDKAIVLEVRPNPARESATLDIRLPKGGTGLLTVSDAQGTVQYSLETDFHAGTTPFRLPMNQIKAKGALFLRLEMPYGSGQAKMVVE